MVTKNDLNLIEELKDRINSLISLLDEFSLKLCERGLDEDEKTKVQTRGL